MSHGIELNLVEILSVEHNEKFFLVGAHLRSPLFLPVACWHPLSKISAHGHGIQVPRYAYTNLFAAILPYADTMMKLLFENFSKSCPLFKIAYI